MNYDSDSDRINPIVGFKKSQNKTGTDYQTKTNSTSMSIEMHMTIFTFNDHNH